MLNHEAAKQDYLSGMKYKEIAEKYGVTINTVKSWKTRHSWDSKKRVHTKKKGCTQKKDAPKVAPTPPPVDEKGKELAEGLTDQQRLFAEIYVRNFNATQAAIKAGYNINSAYSIGYENLRKPRVRAYIEHLKQLKKESIMIGVDDIVERYMRIAFADMTDFVEFGRTAVPIITAKGPLKGLNPETGKLEVLLKEVNDIRLKESYEVDGGLICQIKQGKDGASIKLEDRQKALDWLANYFECNPQDKYKNEFEERRIALQERMVKVQEDKLHGISGDMDAIKEGLQGIMDVIRSPVPDRGIDDE